jgi:phospholipid/cholesterol/gamma-HCH transport system substrate-binding protein
MVNSTAPVAGPPDTIPRMRGRPETKARWIFGALVFLCGAAVLAWYSLASGRYATYQIRTHDSVSGLIEDAPVEFHGVEVGKVKRIELAGPQSVSILLQIRKDAPVTAATVATVTSRGLASKGFTGYVYVSLEDEPTGSPPVPIASGAPYAEIRTAPSRSINLDTAISQVNDNVQYITKLLQTSLDEKTVASLKQSVDSMQKVTALLQTSLDEKTVGSMKQSLDSLQKVTRTLAANSDKMNAIIVNAERATNRLEPLLQSSNDTAKALQTQVLPQAYDALANLDQLSTSLRATTNRIERDPSVLVRGTGKRPPGPGESR